MMTVQARFRVTGEDVSASIGGLFMRYILTLFLAMALPMAAQASAGPKVVVQAAVDGVIQVLKARQDPKHLSVEERQAIAAAVEGYFDFTEMAKRSMGRGWREINDGQRENFVQLFRDLLEHSYGNRLAAFNNQTIEYGQVRIKGKRARVKTKIIGENIEIPVRYSLLNMSDQWRVYDIRIEGLSLVAAFRTDFKAIYKKEGYEGLVKRLRVKVENLKKQDQ